MKHLKKVLGIIYILSVLSSCTKEKEYPKPCLGDCETKFHLIYKNVEIPISSDGYYRIQWDGLNYFQIEGELSELDPHYVINKVPLIECNFDSDYWIVMDSITFRTPMYSYLGWFNDIGLNTPIPIGQYTYTIITLSDLYSPLNIVGYEIPKKGCFDCLYFPTLIGTHSKYTYNPKQNILFDNEFEGDTINIYIQSIFNSDVGETVTIDDKFKIIVL